MLGENSTRARRERVHFSAALQSVAEMLSGRLRGLRIPEAARACLANIRLERIASVYISEQLSNTAAGRRIIAGPTARLENT